MDQVAKKKTDHHGYREVKLAEGLLNCRCNLPNQLFVVRHMRTSIVYLLRSLSAFLSGLDCSLLLVLLFMYIW